MVLTMAVTGVVPRPNPAAAEPGRYTGKAAARPRPERTRDYVRPVQPPGDWPTMRERERMASKSNEKERSRTIVYEKH